MKFNKISFLLRGCLVFTLFLFTSYYVFAINNGYSDQHIAPIDAIDFVEIHPFEINTQNNGYKILSLEEKEILVHGECNIVSNNTSDDIFVPTKLLKEWKGFKLNLPDNVTKELCCEYPGEIVQDHRDFVFCRYNNRSSCPSDMQQYENWSTTTQNTCRGVVSGYHGWSNQRLDGNYGIYTTWSSGDERHGITVYCTSSIKHIGCDFGRKDKTLLSCIDGESPRRLFAGNSNYFCDDDSNYI